MEVTYTTTLYFEVPEEYTENPNEYIKWLSNVPRKELAGFATDIGDGGWGLEE